MPFVRAYPRACTPASGWEKGQVENQVGLVRFLRLQRQFAAYKLPKQDLIRSRR
jgi:IS30 family transposase